MKIIQEYIESVEIDRIEIISAKRKDDYKIDIKFNDGHSRAIDFQSFLTKAQHPSISKYLNEDLFSNFKIINGNLNWNDYDMIFPVHDLYEGNI